MISLTLLVCPHDTAREPDRWFRFAQYCSTHLETSVHFSLSLDFEDFHQQLDKADIVYANPTDSIRLVKQSGFCFLARPMNQYDEVLFIANPQVPNPSLASFQGEKLATVEGLLPTKIALSLLKKQGIQPSGLIGKPSWLSVVSAVSKGEANFGIVYKDTYLEMSAKMQGLVNPFNSSDEKVAFHSLVLSPRAIEYRDKLEHLLLTMQTDDKGHNVLREVHLQGWESITSENISTLEHLVLAA
ncbi:MAG: PhnD/SsuA/transferrin family substrate-binding protein [Nostocaceae cyanobacterium]|nr:PhnD/SsuA/transferrin family substrate-binding protein [Nostocaceae cyanobacterium]